VIDVQHPETWGARPGDIVHVRGYTPYGYMIRLAIPSWGNHDAILCYTTEHGWHVVEAQPFHTRRTPWTEYAHDIERGRIAVAIMRPCGIGPLASATIHAHAQSFADKRPRYDYSAIFWITYNVVFHQDSTRNRRHSWYCTEQTRDCHVPAWDVWGIPLPTPYTTEKRNIEGRLELIVDLHAANEKLPYTDWLQLHIKSDPIIDVLDSGTACGKAV